MDFHPSMITGNSVIEYKYILDNWKNEVPNSVKLINEYAWYNFLINKYDTTMLLCNKYIEAMESNKSFTGKGFTLTLIGNCYDLKGDRAKAIDYYNKSISQFQKDKQNWYIDIMVTPYLKAPYKK